MVAPSVRSRRPLPAADLPETARRSGSSGVVRHRDQAAILPVRIQGTGGAMPVNPTRGERFIVGLRELAGAFGDPGTLLSLMLGGIAVAGLSPTPVLLGFAGLYVANALHYRLPVPVKPGTEAHTSEPQ